MTVFTAVARGGLPTSGTTYDITFGSGFGQPVAVRIVVNGGSTDNTEAARPCMSIGWTDGTRQRVHAFGGEAAAAGRENTWNFYSRNGCIAVPNQSGGSNGLFSFNSWITDGVRLNVDETPSNAYRYTAWAVNGNGVQAYVGDYGSVAPSSQLAVTDPGFQPDCLELFGALAFSSTPTWATTANASLGWSRRSPSIQNVGLVWLHANNVTNIDVEGCVNDNLCIGRIAAGANSPNAFIAAYSSTGFTVEEFSGNNTLAGGGYCAMRLPGVRVWCGVIDTPTSAQVSPYSTPGFEAQSVFGAMSAITSTGTVTTDDSGSSICYGTAAGRGTVTGGCSNVRAQDNDTVAFSTGAIASATIARVLKGDATNAINTNAPGMARTVSGFSIDYSIVLASAAKWPVMAIGYGRSLVVPRRSAIRHLIGR